MIGLEVWLSSSRLNCMTRPDKNIHLVLLVIIFCLSGRVNGAKKTKAFVKDILGARTKIKWEEQLVDPSIAYITSVNVM